MKEKKKSNSGFTLIELIIAMAVLAFLMTAISSLMGSSIMSFKKTKADIRVQTSAQETYNQLADSIMQANSVIIQGYTSDTDLDFSVSGEDVSATIKTIFLVKDNEAKQDLIANGASYGMTGANIDNVKLFSEVSKNEKIYITAMRITTSAQIDILKVPAGNYTVSGSDYVFSNAITGEDVKVINTVINGKSQFRVDGNNEEAYDTLVHTYVFEDENLYYGRQYGFMTAADDVLDMSDEDSKYSHKYSKSFSYVTVGAASGAGKSISGCIAYVDADAGAIGLDLIYNDKNMTYTTLGMVNIRNSYVLKARK